MNEDTLLKLLGISVAIMIIACILLPIILLIKRKYNIVGGALLITFIGFLGSLIFYPQRDQNDWLALAQVSWVIFTVPMLCLLFLGSLGIISIYNVKTKVASASIIERENFPREKSQKKLLKDYWFAAIPLMFGAIFLLFLLILFANGMIKEYRETKERNYWENVIENDTKNVSFAEAKKHLKYERTRQFIDKKIENAMKDLREDTEPEFDLSEFLIFLDEIGYKRIWLSHQIYPEEYSRVVYQRIGTETEKQKIEEYVFLLISNPLTPPEILRELSIHEYGFYLLSRNPNTPPDVLSEIMKKMAPVFLSGAKKYWTNDGREIDTFGVILRLSGNPNTPPEVLFNIY